MATAPHGVSDRLRPFGTSIFAEMSRLALEHRAVNLSQGFPDFDGPSWVIDAAVDAARAGHNQYAPMPGRPELLAAIAAVWAREEARDLDPSREVCVTSGCTEAIAATMLGLLNPGDEVILFEPFYDSYRPCITMGGAVARVVPLRERGGGAAQGRAFWFDPDQLRAAVTPRTRAILVNTPHNPTGKVFTRDELNTIADLCHRHDLVAITDEVYERLIYEPAEPHLRLASLPGMWDRTLTLSSLGKTFSLTGWKIGWAVGPAPLIAAVRAAHQFLTYAVSTPMQIAAAAALTNGQAYVAALVADYARKRNLLAAGLTDLGFDVYRPSGTYFIMAGHAAVSTRLALKDDVALCRHLTAKVGVAAIPPSAFYATPGGGSGLVRFAFCKKDATLDEALRRLRAGLA